MTKFVEIWSTISPCRRYKCKFSSNNRIEEKNWNIILKWNLK